MRKNTMEYLGSQSQQLPPPATSHMDPLASEQEDHPVVAQEPDHTPTINEPSPAKLLRKQSTKSNSTSMMPPTPASPNDASNDATSSDDDEAASSTTRTNNSQPRAAAVLRHLQPPHKTPGEGFSDDSDYFPGMQHLHHSTGHRRLLRASSQQRKQSKERKLQRKQTEQWKGESGMGNGVKTDRLGDGDTTSDDTGLGKAKETDNETPILREALKGNMIVEKNEDGVEDGDEQFNAEKKMDEAEIEKMQDAERKGFGEVY
jgi:hypothetical protein